MSKIIIIIMDLVRELKKLWSMKVTVMPIVDGALGTILKLLQTCCHLH